MSEIIPVHELVETETTYCKIVKLDVPTGYQVTEAHRHTYYEIMFFSNGGGEHMIDFNYYPVKDHSIHFVSSGQVHALNRNKESTGHVVIFSKDFPVLNATDKHILNEFPAFNKTVSSIFTPGAAVFEEIENIVKIMHSEYVGGSAYKEKILSSYVSILLLKCKNLLTDTDEYKRTDTASLELLQKFNNLMEDNFITLHKVSDYAERLNITPNYLSDVIKKATGKTAGELIHDRIILEAKRLLLHSSITAKELAYTLNFNDPSYFSRFFKTNTGMSPEAFRTEIRKKYQH